MNAVIDTPPPQAAASAPALILPAADIFSTRAARFAQLAQGHALGEWLDFLAALTSAQQSCLAKLPAPTLPDAGQLARAREFRMPPLPAQTWPRDPAWRAALRCLCEDLAADAPAALRPALAALGTRPADEVEALADRILRTEFSGPDTAVLPIVAAALQVYWTRMAQQLGSTGIAPLDVSGVCPCCGFLPVASVVKSVGEVGNLRYLHCALCNTEWNLVRVKCAACDATEGISYRHLEGEGQARHDGVRAESCDACRSYLKIMYQEKGALDPVADDLASLALDILMDEAGYGRAGPNLLLVPGDA